MKKNIILALASTLFSLMLFVALVEGVFGSRYESWKLTYANNGDWYGGLTTVSKNPVLMWEYRPDSESNGLRIKIRTNRYGFRDYDYESVAKPTNVSRIAFIGDSVTLGLKVDHILGHGAPDVVFEGVGRVRCRQRPVPADEDFRHPVLVPGLERTNEE